MEPLMLILLAPLMNFLILSFFGRNLGVQGAQIITASWMITAWLSTLSYLRTDNQSSAVNLFQQPLTSQAIKGHLGLPPHLRSETTGNPGLEVSAPATREGTQMVEQTDSKMPTSITEGAVQEWVEPTANVLVDEQLQEVRRIHVMHMYDWIVSGLVNVEQSWLLDSLSLTMAILVVSISLVVHLYSMDYMSADPHQVRFLSYLSLFTFFMLMLIFANNLVGLFLGWEGVGICSYLLISFWYTRLAAQKAAVKAILYNRIGDCGLLAAIGLIVFYVQSVDYGTIFSILPYYQNLAAGWLVQPVADWNSTLVQLTDQGSENVLRIAASGAMLSGLVASSAGTVGVGWGAVSCIDLICAALFLGAMGKSAQFFLHVWLTDAMEGPTPVSALIHAATMVTAGVYLLIRCSFINEYSHYSFLLIALISMLTIFFASSAGVAQLDIKKAIAYSTCSQLGYMVLSCAFSQYHLAIFHLFNHGWFKALLFLSAGLIIHANSDEQGLHYTGPNSSEPLVYCFFFVATLASIGFPYLTGFYSKDLIIEVLYITPHGLIFGYLCSLCIVLATLYSLGALADFLAITSEEEYLSQEPVWTPGLNRVTSQLSNPLNDPNQLGNLDHRSPQRFFATVPTTASPGARPSTGDSRRSFASKPTNPLNWLTKPSFPTNQRCFFWSAKRWSRTLMTPVHRLHGKIKDSTFTIDPHFFRLLSFILLTGLAIASIFVGYLGKDLFSGPGSNYFASSIFFAPSPSSFPAVSPLLDLEANALAPSATASQNLHQPRNPHVNVIYLEALLPFKYISLLYILIGLVLSFGVHKLSNNLITSNYLSYQSVLFFYKGWLVDYLYGFIGRALVNVSWDFFILDKKTLEQLTPLAFANIITTTSAWITSLPLSINPNLANPTTKPRTAPSQPPLIGSFRTKTHYPSIAHLAKNTGQRTLVSSTTWSANPSALTRQVEQLSPFLSFRITTLLPALARTVQLSTGLNSRCQPTRPCPAKASQQHPGSVWLIKKVQETRGYRLFSTKGPRPSVYFQLREEQLARSSTSLTKLDNQITNNPKTKTDLLGIKYLILVLVFGGLLLGCAVF